MFEIITRYPMFLAQHWIKSENVEPLLFKHFKNMKP